MSNKVEPDWMRDWQPLVDRIGSALEGGPPRFGPEVVELSAIRRWLEPLEFDSPLHRDDEIARAHDWPGVIAPYTAVWTFLMPAVWESGGAHHVRRCLAPPSSPERPVPMPDPQRRFDEVAVGDRLPGATYPLPVYRLVMAAGATRDFTAIHNNDEYARAAGAPSMYANTVLLLGMWERVLRDYIGSAGTIRAIRDFRMVRFTTVGSWSGSRVRW